MQNQKVEFTISNVIWFENLSRGDVGFYRRAKPAMPPAPGLPTAIYDEQFGGRHGNDRVENTTD